MTRTVRVRLETDVAGARRDIRGVADELRGLHATAERTSVGVQRIGTGLASVVGGFAGAGVVEIIKRVVNAASDLNETVSKSKQVFGQSSAEVLRWSKTSAESMGLSQRAALDGASSFQNLFSQIGITGEKATGMSKSLVQLASDFASFHNAEPEAVMDALLSATRGEYDALQRFVPTVNAAAIQTRALADSGKKAASELTNAEKATALYSLVVEGAGAATGDFARTSSGAANQQRIFKANLENTAASIGSTFLPVYGAMLQVVNSIGPGFILAGAGALLLSKGLGLAGGMASAFGAQVRQAAAYTVVGSDAAAQYAVIEARVAAAGGVATAGQRALAQQYLLTAQMANQAALSVGGVAGATGIQIGTATAATAANGRLAGALTLVAGAARSAGAAMAASAGTLGLLAVAGGATYLYTHMKDNEKAAKDFAGAISDLGDEYERTGRLSKEFLTEFAKGSPDAARRIEMYVREGVTIQDLTKARMGDLDALKKVDEVTTRLIEKLKSEQPRNPFSGDFWDLGDNQKRADLINQLERYRQEARGAEEATRGFADAVGASTDPMDRFNAEQQTLIKDLLTLSSASSTAEARAKALGDSYHALFDTVMNLNEANESYEASTDKVSESVQSNGRSLDIHTAKGRANRDAIEGVLTALVAQDQAELASGVTLDQVTKNHARHIEELRKEAARLGLNKEETEKLVAAYGTVPTDVNTTFAQKNAGIVKEAFRQILTDIAYLLKYGFLPIHSDPRNIERTRTGQPFFATGGPVYGPGTATSDSIPAMLSAGEFVVNARSTARNRQLLEAINEGQGFAAGGLARPHSQRANRGPARPAEQLGAEFVGELMMDFSQIGMVAIRAEAIAAAKKKFAESMASGPGVGPGGPGWQWQMAALRAVFPGLALLSGYRPGSRVASGGLSYHAFGRAVDVPPRWDVFNWLAANYGPRTKELIFSPARGRQVKNGSPHLYSGPVVAQHYNHIHWAMREGGLVDASRVPRMSMDSGRGVLMPGPNWVDNGIGRPERITSAGGGAMTLKLEVTVRNDDGRVLAVLRKEVIARGGNVQAVITGRS